MPAYECPQCGGGFPESPDSECPWCGLAVGGSYFDDLPGRPASDLFDTTPSPSQGRVDPLDLPDEFRRASNLPPTTADRSRRGERTLEKGGDDS
jgi:hypothetical protein